MVKLNHIYTRTGDSGQTGLVGGVRVAKCSARMEAIGEVDETNAAIGVLRTALFVTEHDAELMRVQHDLFDLGADLATPLAESESKALRIVNAQVERLERAIDNLNEALAPLNSFVLPGGSAAASYAHLARTITRRAERRICALMEAESVNTQALCYINRLSDYLFVLARALNANGERDVLWQPGVNRYSAA